MVSIAEQLHTADYVVADNILPEEDYRKIKNYIWSPQRDWHLQQDNPDPHDPENIDPTDTFGLGHLIYHQEFHQSPQNIPPEQQELVSLFMKELDKHFYVRDLIRVRGGLQPSVADFKGYHPPHVDFPFPHYVALFYMCEESSGKGCTAVYAEKDDPYLGQPHLKTWKHEDLTLVDEIQPRENRALIFKGNVLHSLAPPKDISIRIAININFVGYPREESIQDEQSV